MHRPLLRLPLVVRETARWLVQVALLVAVPPTGLTNHPHAPRPAPHAASGAFTSGPFELEVAWSRALGIGYAGLAIADGRVVTLHAEGGRDEVVALDAASGATLWSHPLATTFPAGGGSEGGAKSAPTIEAGVVYALGPSGDLVALRLEDGSALWRRRLSDELGASPPEFGFATSPLVVGELLFVQSGGEPGRRLVALDKTTGELQWATGDDPPDYASPVVAELAGTRQILSVTHSAVAGLDPESGRILWSRTSEMDVVASPVPLGDDRFLLPGTSRAVAMRVKRVEAGLSVERLWETQDLKGSYSLPVHHDDFLYGYAGEFLTCVSAKDGARRWKSRQPGGRGLILVDGHLVIFGRGGNVVVAEATPGEYREVARIPALDRTGYTYPSFADGRILVRNTRGIAAVQVAAAGSGRDRAASYRELARAMPLRIRGTVHDVEDWFFARLNPRAAPGASDDERSNANAAIGFHQETLDARGSRQFRTDGRSSYGLALMRAPAGAFGLLSPEVHVVVYYPDTITDLVTLTSIVGAPGPALPTSWVAFASTIDTFTSAPGPVLVSSGEDGGRFGWSNAPLAGSLVGELGALGTPTPIAVAPGVHELEPGAFRLGGATYDQGVGDSGAVAGATIVSRDFQA